VYQLLHSTVIPINAIVQIVSVAHTMLSFYLGGGLGSFCSSYGFYLEALSGQAPWKYPF
jgi:hypothetical protein